MSATVGLLNYRTMDSMVHMTNAAFKVGFGRDIIDLVDFLLYICALHTKALSQFALDHFSDMVNVA